MSTLTNTREVTPGRMMGLGAVPCEDALAALAKCAFNSVPVLEYTTLTFSLPMLDGDLSSVLGSTVNLLNSAINPPDGVIAADSTFYSNGVLQTDMFVIGYGCHTFGEPMSFSQIGNALSVACPCPVSTQPPVSPDAFTQNDLVNGALGVTAGISPALIEWGFASWQAMWNLANAYQFNWIFSQRMYLVQEMLADSAYFGPMAEGTGMGTSDTAVQQYIHKVNGRYDDLGATSRFLPVTHRRVGSTNNGNAGPTGPTFAGTNVGVFHVTNDYQLAPVSWGGLATQGTTSMQSPFRRLPKSAFLERGNPIVMQLRESNAYNYNEMLRYMSISENTGGGVANVTIDANISGLTIGGGTTSVAGLELTVDVIPPNQFVSQQIQTDRKLFKGGQMKLSVLIKGYEVQNSWKRYLIANCTRLCNYVDMPGQANQLAGVGMMPGG